MVEITDPNIIKILLSILGGGGLGGWGLNRWRKFREDRITLRSIKSRSDKDITAIIELYESVIEPHQRIRPVELMKFVGSPSTDGPSDHLLVWKKNGEAVGFLKFMHCLPERWIFIAYLGVNKEGKGVRQATSRFIVRDLAKYIKKMCGECKLVFFEAESNKRHLRPVNADDRLYGLSRLLKAVLLEWNAYLYEIDMEYFQPDMPTDSDDDLLSRSPMSFYVISFEPLGQTMPRSQVIELLKCLYIRIYCRTYELSEMHDLYKTALSDYIQGYEKALPEEVRLLA